MLKRYLMFGGLLILVSTVSMARDVPVTTLLGLTQALEYVEEHDVIVLAPGVYDLGGDHLSRRDLKNVTIRGENDPTKKQGGPSIITGARTILFQSPNNFVLENLIIENGVQGGLNIDDNDNTGEIPNPWVPARAITLRNLIVRNIGTGGGNVDGIKLSGLEDFHIDNVRILNWGDGGSAIDMVGCHKGSIENTFIKSEDNSPFTTGIVMKGGSHAIDVKDNRIELSNGRALKIGGSTDGFLFRPPLNHAPAWEASDITVEFNTLIGGRSTVSYVNSDNGRVFNNVIYEPGAQVIKIISEIYGNDPITSKIIQPPRNGKFIDNTVIATIASGSIVDTDAASENGAGTFQFANNQWYNRGTPGDSTPALPTVETGGVYGVDPHWDPVTSGAAGACKTTFDLPANQWRQIALPCDPGDNNTVAAVFGEDGLGVYGTNWVIYRYTDAGYSPQALSSPLDQGVGYWIVQNNSTGTARILDMPDTSAATATGNFDLKLATKASTLRWNMIGYPYQSGQLLGKVRVLSNSAPCRSPGCNLEDAQTSQLVTNRLWTYDSGYKQLGIHDKLDPWTGYWLPTLNRAYGKEPKLRLRRP